MKSPEQGSTEGGIEQGSGLTVYNPESAKKPITLEEIESSYAELENRFGDIENLEDLKHFEKQVQAIRRRFLKIHNDLEEQQRIEFQEKFDSLKESVAQKEIQLTPELNQGAEATELTEEELAELGIEVGGNDKDTGADAETVENAGQEERPEKNERKSPREQALSETVKRIQETVAKTEALVTRTDALNEEELAVVKAASDELHGTWMSYKQMKGERNVSDEHKDAIRKWFDLAKAAISRSENGGQEQQKRPQKKNRRDRSAKEKSDMADEASSRTNSAAEEDGQEYGRKGRRKKSDSKDPDAIKGPTKKESVRDEVRKARENEEARKENERKEAERIEQEKKAKEEQDKKDAEEKRLKEEQEAERIREEKAEKKRQEQERIAKRRALIFEGPMPKSKTFESSEQALNEAGFVEFLQDYDEYHGFGIEDDIESGVTDRLKDVYEHYASSRFAAREMQEVFKKDIVKDLGGEIELPKDAIKSMDGYFARIAIEEPHAAAMYADHVKLFTALPKEIEQEEEAYKSEIKNFGGDGSDDILKLVSKDAELGAKQDEINGLRDLLDSGAGFFKRANAVARLYKDGVLGDQNAISHLWRPKKKIEEAVQKMHEVLQGQKDDLDRVRTNLRSIDQAKRLREGMFEVVRKSIFADFEPSADIRNAVNLLIKEKIEETIADDEASISDLEKRQSLMDKVTEAQKNGNIEYLDDEEVTDQQKKLDKAIHAELGKQIEEAIQKSDTKTQAYTNLEKALVKWLNRPDIDNRRFGSVKGSNARLLIIEIIEKKKNSMPKADARRYLLSHILLNVKNGTIGKKKA